MPGTQELVEALLLPSAYPVPPSRVDLMQTQMSLIFIAGEVVYKVKKPVNLGYLDYTTLEMRLHLCRKEVELNRRLCSDYYLGVVPITQEGGVIRFEGRGEPFEYAVKMRFLPPDRMLNVLLEQDEVTVQMMEMLARRLAQFHADAATSEAISAFGSMEAVSVNIEENASQTINVIGQTISRPKYDRLNSYARQFLTEHAGIFRARMAGGRIRDCHGDLHAAHICFASDGLCIYDCIEFNDRFRYCDVASEIAFTAMDLDHYGRADLSRVFLNDYCKASADEDIKKLLTFYKCYRAYVRGKVEGFKLADPLIPQADKLHIRDTAASYFDLADSYIRARPLLVITTGLTGTGKSTVAKALARRLGLVMVSSDVVRKTLAGIPLTDHKFDDFTGGIYTTEMSRRTYDTLLERAADALAGGSSVVLDAAFTKVEQRLQASELAERLGAEFFVIECTLAEDEVRRRLDARLKETSVSDGRWEIYEPQKMAFELVREVPAANHVIINSSKTTDVTVRAILERIESSGTGPGQGG